MHLGRGISVAGTRSNILDFTDLDISNPLADDDKILVLPDAGSNQPEKNEKNTLQK
jgi:hypothetical protein